LCGANFISELRNEFSGSLNKSFILAKNHQKGDTDPNFWRERPCLSGGQISPKFNGFWGESVATGLSEGYKFNGPVQKCRQLSGNLPWEAHHCCYTTKLGKKKHWNFELENYFIVHLPREIEREVRSI
jgi:hypothetical protein